MVKLEKVAKELEDAYQKQKDKECEELHNAIADVLSEKSVSIQNALFVFKMLEWELLRAKYEQFMGNVVIPEGKVPVKKDAKLTM